MGTARVNNLDVLLPRVKQLAEKFLEECKKQGLPVMIYETYRSQERQNALYAQGRTTPGAIVTKTLRSYHITKKAFDVVKLVNGQPSWDNSDGFFEKVGKVGQSVGLTWGGSWTSFKDLPHFQYDGVNAALPLVETKVNLDLNSDVDHIVKDCLLSKSDGEYLKAQVYTTERVREFIKDFAISFGGKGLSLADDVNTLVKAGIISSSDYWLGNTYSVSNVIALVDKYEKHIM